MLEVLLAVDFLVQIVERVEFLLFFADDLHLPAFKLNDVLVAAAKGLVTNSIR